MKYYTKTDEWVKVKDGKAYIGLTDFAVGELGDIVFVELPQVGDELTQNAVLGAVESVKAASDIYMPIGGLVVTINEALEDNPELLNENPNENYLIVIEDFNEEELKSLLTKEQYGK